MDTTPPSLPALLNTTAQRTGLARPAIAKALAVSVSTLEKWAAGQVPHVLTAEGAAARLHALPSMAKEPSKPAPVAVARPRAGERTRQPVRAPMAKGAPAGREGRQPLFKPSGRL